MEAKKSIRIVAFLAVAAVAVFVAVLFLNRHIDSKNPGAAATFETVEIPANQQSFSVPNQPVRGKEDFFEGTGDGAMDVIVYEDYADPFSADLAATVEKAAGEFKDTVNFVYRPYAVSGSSLSLKAAQGVACAWELGKGVEYRKEAFAAARDSKLSEESLTVIAQKLGVDMETFNACLTNGEKKERIEGLVTAADNFSVTGAPTIFVGDEMIVGARPYENFTDSNGDEIEGLGQVISRKVQN
ncbi:MAG: DsbA family protein [Bacillota bacterium]